MLKNKIKMFAVVGITMMATVCGMVACGSGNGSVSVREEDYTATVQTQLIDKIGFPEITNGFEYSQYKEIMEKRDDPKLVCYWYTKNEMSGKWIYQGECIGFGIPYGVSLTSPEYSEYHSNGGTVTLPLAEPNGLYTNNVSSNSTWILTRGNKGKIEATYVEDEIIVRESKISKELCEDWSVGEDY